MRHLKNGRAAPPIFIFYHLFAIGDWRKIWDIHIHRLRTSRLYDACHSLQVGVVYRDTQQLAEVLEALDDLPKVSLYYCREISTSPLLWRQPVVRLAEGRLGECETICAMTHYAQRQSAAAIYLFLHTKGITNPSVRARKHDAYFLSQGLPPASTDEQANDFILSALNNVVTDWRDHVAALDTASFSYRLFNFFWVRGQLLHRFDFNDYIARHARQAPPQQRRHSLDADWDSIRHLFALFPIKLYAFVNGLTLDRPPYEYIDVTI